MHEKLFADRTVGVITVRFSLIYLYFKKHNNLLIGKKKAVNKQKNINGEETGYSDFRLEKSLVSYVTTNSSKSLCDCRCHCT